MDSIMDRRGFIGALPGTALALGAVAGPSSLSGLGLLPAHLRHAPAAVPIGIQLYTLRSIIGDEPGPVLAALAEIGYEEVELAGMYGRTASELRAELDAAGLRATSGHHELEEIRSGWDEAVQTALTLGHSQMVLPWLPDSERTTDGLARLADDLNRAGEVATEAGLRFGYHNHDWEHLPLPDGTVPMDFLLSRTDPGVVDWQMDIFWTVHAGADPLAYLELHSGRVPSVHVKDRTADGDMVDVGAGVIDFAVILGDAAGRGLQHAYVEHDNPFDPLETARASYEALSVALQAGPA